jgi:uncharacterized protein YgiM (DUF1202 family)
MDKKTKENNSVDENIKTYVKVEDDKKYDISPEHIKVMAVSAAKVVVPVAACVIVVAAIASFIGSDKTQGSEPSVAVAVSSDENVDDSANATLTDEPLEVNAYDDVNELMQTFYKALADGDMDVVRALRDYNDDTEIIQYEKKSEFIDSYDNVTCYTKQGVEEGSYFVYVSYEVKVKDIDTKAPGLNAFYVYTGEDGNLVIDGNMEENITAAFKLVTNQDDVVDLYNEVDVNYKNAIASDEALNTFMAELPTQIKTSVGEALAQLEAENGETAVSDENESESVDNDAAALVDEGTSGDTETVQNQEVNQVVRATDTVNVRSSDSEQADKIGKAAAGTEMTRTEIRINGWSKVVFEGKEAYIKSDYLEVVSSNDTTNNDTTVDTANNDNTAQTTQSASGTVVATTNVNVRSNASETADKLGTAVAGNTYTLLGQEGDWYKISFGNETGYVKAEYFEKQ